MKKPRRRLLWGVLAFFLLLPAVAAVLWLWRFPVGGALVLGTAYGDTESELFVDDTFVGTGEAEVSWSDIMGWNGGSPLGVILPADAMPPGQDPSHPAFLAEITAERLAGPGSEIVTKGAGSPAWLRHGRHEASLGEILLRRGDGQLDQVFCLDTRLTDLYGRTYRVLVPIRVRSSTNEARFFTTESRSAILGRFANILHRFSMDWNFESIDPPAELTTELEETGLWRPTGSIELLGKKADHEIAADHTTFRDGHDGVGGR